MRDVKWSPTVNLIGSILEVLYGQVNLRIDALSKEVVRALERIGYKAWALPSSTRSDPGNSPH